MGQLYTVAVFVGVRRRLHSRLVRLMIGAYNPPTISDLVIPCPNCQSRMERVDPAVNGGRKYRCIWACEDATNMTKEIQEIYPSASTNQKRRWIVPGSKDMKYTVVVLKASEDPSRLWQCSCPAWTRHTPRKDCKHITRVKAEMNVNTDSYGKVKPTAYEKGVKYAFNYSVSKGLGKPIKMTNIQVPDAPPKPKTVTVVIPVHVPKTEGRKFR